jgi:hypothetical protein
MPVVSRPLLSLRRTGSGEIDSARRHFCCGWGGRTFASHFRLGQVGVTAQAAETQCSLGTMRIPRPLLWAAAGAIATLAFILSCDDSRSVPDAGADDASMCGGTCTISGPLQTKTADTDIARLASGSAVPTSAGEKLTSGPFVLTDLVVTNFTAGSGPFVDVLFLSSTADCANDGSSLFEVRVDADVNHLHGLRLAVPAGQTLCASEPAATQGLLHTRVFWSGFKPYE